MDEYQCVVVDLAYYDNSKNIIVFVSEKDEDFIIETPIDGIELKSVGQGYFEVFQELRDKFEYEHLTKELETIFYNLISEKSAR